MKRFLALALLCVSTPLFGQSWYQNNAYTTSYINGTRVVNVIPGVKVQICTNISGACVQQPVYLDQALTTQITQPFSVDGSGNFGFWIPDGTYSYRVLNAQGLQIQGYPFTAGASGGVPLTTFQTNGTNNGSQTLLDLDNGSGVIVSNTSGGHVNFSVDASTLNPPQYQTAAANLTAASATTTVTLPSVSKGSRLIAFADSNTYNCLPQAGSPYYPTITDSQGNIWTVDASAFSSYIGGNSGANMIVADTVLSASGSITVTATQPAVGGTCANAYLTVAEYANVVGVDVAGVQACSLGCTGSLAPSATAVAQNAEIAVVLSETASSGGAVATPGSLAFSDASHTWAYIWQFGAANVGQASTSTITNFSQNFPGAAIILLKSNLTFQTGSTVNPGTSYQLPAYGPSVSNYLYPTNVTTDSTGNNLNVPGFLAGKATTVASSSILNPTSQIFHVTGTATVNYINVPAVCLVTGAGCQVTVIADGAFKFAKPGGGTQAVNFNATMTPGQAISLAYDNATAFWYPVMPLGGLQTTVTGTTAGTAVWSQPQQTTTWKQAVVYLNGYENTTATAQTITLPASYATVGYVIADGGSCTGVTISGATVTLPASMGATQTGLCEVRGY